jgi:hypothetical protein
MFGLFLLFVLDQNKKVVSIFDPIPIPTLGKNVLKTMVDNLNLALEVANPAFKDDISKWECLVPVAPTNSHWYESFKRITILIDSFNAHYVFISYMQCPVRLSGF